MPLYPPVDPNDETATLTVRDTIWEKPHAAATPRLAIRAARARTPGTLRGDTKCPRIAMASGFEPGRIYELKYRASNPPVSGVGLAAIRDVASAVKYGNGAIVPVRGRYLHVYGASQSGRFLRLFLHDGFNADEQGRRGVRRRDAAHRRRRARRLQHALLAGGRARSVRRAEVSLHRCARSATRPTGRTDGLLAKYPRRICNRKSSTRIRRSSIGAPAAPRR